MTIVISNEWGNNGHLEIQKIDHALFINVPHKVTAADLLKILKMVIVGFIK